MAIVQTLNHVSQLEQAFKAAGRGNKFSYEGLEVLFDYLDELEGNIELDVVALCCDYEESSIDEIIDQYGIEVDTEDMDEDEIEAAKKDAVQDYLSYHTSLCGETDDGFVFASF